MFKRNIARKAGSDADIIFEGEMDLMMGKKWKSKYFQLNVDGILSYSDGKGKKIKETMNLKEASIAQLIYGEEENQIMIMLKKPISMKGSSDFNVTQWLANIRSFIPKYSISSKTERPPPRTPPAVEIKPSKRARLQPPSPSPAAYKESNKSVPAYAPPSSSLSHQINSLNEIQTTKKTFRRDMRAENFKKHINEVGAFTAEGILNSTTKNRRQSTLLSRSMGEMQKALADRKKRMEDKEAKVTEPVRLTEIEKAELARKTEAKQAELKAKEAETARIKAEKLAELKAKEAEASRIKVKKLAELKAKEDEAARIKVNKLAELKAKEAEAARIKAEILIELKAKEDEAARIKVEKLAELKAKEDEAARIKAEKLAKLKAKEAEAARIQEAKIAELKTKEAARIKVANEEELARKQSAEASELARLTDLKKRGLNPLCFADRLTIRMRAHSSMYHVLLLQARFRGNRARKGIHIVN